MIGEWIRRLRYLLRRSAMEEELRREMESHRALMHDPRAFGNTLRLREEAHDAWGWTWLDNLIRDTRLALRTLRRSPGFALTAIVTLGLGIGANIGMFTFANSVLLRPLYENPDAVVAVYSQSTTGSGYRLASYASYLDLRDSTTDLFANLAAVSTTFVGLDLGEGARRTLASNVTANYFEIFDRPLALGRPFTTEEERTGADAPVAIISYSLWQQRGGDASIVGRSVRVNGDVFTVVGVTAKGFTGTGIPGPDVWLPFNKWSAGATMAARNAFVLSVIGRLRPGTSFATASSVLTTVGTRLAQDSPAINTGYTLAMSAPSRLMFMPGPGGGRTLRTLALLLMILPLIVLCVTCLNLANLLLARGHVRRKELAIRSSLGGGRSRLIRQLLIEGLVLALAGSAVGLVLSRWATYALVESLRPLVPVSLTLPELDLDSRVLFGTLGFSLLASLVFGAWPAWHLTGRAVASDLKRQVSEETRQPGGIKIGNVLVIGQVALSLLLLASGGLFLKSALAAAIADPGFRLDRGLLAEMDPSLTGYDDEESRRFYLTLMDRLRAVPGVESVTIGSSFPFTGLGESRDVAPAGVSAIPANAVDARFVVAGRDYARTLGFPMLEGRDFTDAELSPGPSERVALVDQSLAQRLWPDESAVGQLIQFLDAKGSVAGKPLRVIGMVPSLKHSFGNPRPYAAVYVPLGQHDEDAMTLQFRIAEGQDEGTMMAAAARVIRDLDPRVGALRLQTWRGHLNASLTMWLYRAGAAACVAFGGIALLLAVIGVYGVKSYVVSRRTREFGIRIAIGAHRRTVLWQVLRAGGRITAVGIAIGALLALGAGRLLAGFLYGVDAVEPMVLVTAPLILLASSLLASYIPALRATNVDPTVALRTE